MCVASVSNRQLRIWFCLEWLAMNLDEIRVFCSRESRTMTCFYIHLSPGNQFFGDCYYLSRLFVLTCHDWFETKRDSEVVKVENRETSSLAFMGRCVRVMIEI